MCSRDIEYPDKHLFNRAERELRCCKSCGSKKANEPKKIKSFDRNCPNCQTTLTYKSYHSWWMAKKNNQCCISCSKKGIPKSAKFKEHLSKIMSGEGNPMYGKHHTQQMKDLISNINKGNTAGLGYKFSDNSKQKMREVVIRRIKKYGIHSRNFNPDACKFIEEFGKKNGYNFQHALNGGEISVAGYLVDGYDKDKNVVFEYDEKRHFDCNGKLKLKDCNRMNCIKSQLDCRFFRYNEITKVVEEY